MDKIGLWIKMKDGFILYIELLHINFNLLYWEFGDITSLVEI